MPADTLESLRSALAKAEAERDTARRFLVEAEEREERMEAQRDAAIIEAKALRDQLQAEAETCPRCGGDGVDAGRTCGFCEQARAALAAKPDPSLIVVSAASVRERDEREARLMHALREIAAYADEHDEGQYFACAEIEIRARRALANAPDTRLRVVRLPSQSGDDWIVSDSARVELLHVGSDTTEVAIVHNGGESVLTGSVEQARSLALALLAAAEQGGGK